MLNNKQLCLADRFSPWEKIYAQLTFFGMGILGTIGLVIADWIWVFPYLIIYWYGIPGIVQRHLVCPRCPHLYKYNDCLQIHPSITQLLVKERKTNPFSFTERTLFLLIFILIPIYPIYWLLPSPLLLIPFLLSAVMWYSGQLFYFCKRCRVAECPFNRQDNI